MASKKQSTTYATIVTVCIGLIASFWIVSRGGAESQDGYPYQDSRRKLEAIGRALQIYRAEQIVKAPEYRVDFRDAGLPHSVLVLLREGQPWTVEGGQDTLLVLFPNRVTDGLKSQFTKLYWPVEQYEKWGDLEPYFKERGEKLPILADLNMNSVEDMVKPNAVLKALILRLNGEVQIVEFPVQDRMALLRR